MKKSFRGLLQFTKVKKGSSDLWNKQGSSFENVDVLKNSEKVPHSKSSFYNQLIKCSLFLVSLWPVINTEERTRIASPCVAALNSLNLIYIGGCADLRTPLLWTGVSLKNEPIFWLEHLVSGFVCNARVNVDASSNAPVSRLKLL